MNLQPLYDLKERLEYAAIAGTALMGEDFRLRRAVEAMIPLASANPVFAKISAAAKSLLTAPQDGRSARLLDVLSLVDAVVYTQGVSGVTGGLEPIAPGNGSYVQVPYGVLQPLLTALGGTGSGRTAIIREHWQTHPEYFSDFRVLPHVVGALGDHYAELADLIALILLKQGPSVIPMLKAGFDPAGKTEMARRVRLVAQLAGEKENDWFVSILPDTKKDLREAVIQALSLCQDNAGLLLELCQSERGKLKEAALRALAMMEDDDCIAFLTKEIRKRPDCVVCLRGVSSGAAADLAAETLEYFLGKLLDEKKTYDQTVRDKLVGMTSALCGKYAPRVGALWNWIAARMEGFAAIVPEQNVYGCDFSVAEHLQKTMMLTVLWNNDPELLTLANRLAEVNREWFLGCGFLADMARLSASQLYEAYGPLVVRRTMFKRESGTQRTDRIQILRGLAAVNWSDELRGYYVVFQRFDALTGSPVTTIRRMDGLDSRWVELVTDPKVCTDGGLYYFGEWNHCTKVDPAADWLLHRLIDPGSDHIASVAGQWMYQRVMENGSLNVHFLSLIKCGWKNWQGVLAHCARKKGELNYFSIMSILKQLPISNAEKAAELRQLDQLAAAGKLKVQHGYWPHPGVQRDIALLEADPNAEI